MTTFLALPRTTAASAHAEPTLPAPTIPIFMIQYPFARFECREQRLYRRPTLATLPMRFGRDGEHFESSARAIAASVIPAASATRTAGAVGVELRANDLL